MTDAETDPGAAAGATTTDLCVGTDGETLPLQDVLTGRGFVTGKSGSGKSNTGGVVVEELLERGVPVVVVDPDGEHATIAAEYDLLHAGAEVDPDADLTLTAENAAEIAATAYRRRAPVVLDLTGVYGDDEQQEAVAAVCRRLFQLATRAKSPTLLLLEELHEWAPNRGGGEAHDAIIKLAKRGRKHGLGVVGLTQRPADASKGFITQADWLAWHRLTWQNDLDVAADMLGTEYARAVEELDTGECILQADWTDGARRVNWRRKRTPDAGAAPSAHTALNSAAEIDADLLAAFDGDGSSDSIMSAGEDAGGGCDGCPFCAQGIEPPAHVAAAAAEGVVEVSRVLSLKGDSGRAGFVSRYLDDAGLEPGDTVSLGVDDDAVRLWFDDRGLLTYTAQDTKDGAQVILAQRGLDLLGAGVGDHIQLVEDDHAGLRVERVTDRANAPDYPLLACKQPYTEKTDGETADYAELGQVSGYYLGVDETDRVTVVETDDPDTVEIVPGDVEGVASYAVRECAIVFIGARGLAALGAVDGDRLLARPGDGTVRLTVDRGGGQ